MVNYETIVKVIDESSKISTNKIVIRKLEKILSKNITEKKPVKIITGIRRCGKSFIFKRLYLRLLKKGIPKSNILFINFENDLLNDYCNLNDLRTIYETFKTKSNSNFRLYLFLDEIQNVKDWEKFVRSLYDSTDYDIYVTGSNSHLLSSEFSSVLGGRILEYHILPMSFIEMMDYHNFDYKDPFFKQENIDIYARLCSDYINFGGFPETFNLDDEQRKNYRESLFEKIIIKDIMRRYSIGTPNILKDLFIYLSKNIGSIINYSKIAIYSKISDKTIQKYTQFFINVFLIKKLEKQEWKSKRIFQTQSKFYFIDNLFSYNSITSRKLENLVHSELLRQADINNITFLRNEKGQEIDFMIEKNNSYTCIQVCWDLNDENIKREIRGLLNIQKYNITEIKYVVSYLLIIYADSRIKKEEYEGVRIINIYDFLLNPSKYI